MASLALTACGVGTESGAPAGDGRNVAIDGDDGLPFPGYATNLTSVVIDQRTGAPWVSVNESSDQPEIKVGTVTGGLAKFRRGDTWTVDTNFSRVTGQARSIAIDPVSGEIFVGGRFSGVGNNAKRSNLVIFDANGAQRENVETSFNGSIDSITLRGRSAYLAGYFTNVATGNSNYLTNGYAVIDRPTGQLIQPPVFQNMPLGQAVVLGLSFPNNASTRAAVFFRDFSTNRYRINLHELTTGEFIGNIASSTTINGFADLGNGIVAYTPSTANVVEFFDVTRETYLGRYSLEPNVFVKSMKATGSTLRILTTGGGWRFRDINPSTRTLVKMHSLQSEPVPRDIIWASESETLTSMGDLFTSTQVSGGLYTSTARRLVNPAPYWDVLNTAAQTADGLMLGGVFSTVAETTSTQIARLPADGSVTAQLESSPHGGRVVASTPHGVVVREHAGKLVLYPSGPASTPVTVAAASGTTNVGWRCPPTISDVEWTGDRLWVTGCWVSLAVGAGSAAKPTVEIDISGATPRIVTEYPTTPGSQIAVGSRHLMVKEGGRLVVYVRGVAGGELWAVEARGDVTDIVAYQMPNNQFDEFVVGGWQLSLGVNPAVNSLWRVRPMANLLIPVTWAVAPVRALHVDSPGTQQQRVYVASLAMTVDSAQRSIISIDRNFRVDPTVVTADGIVSDVVAQGDAVWFVGDFTSIVVDGAGYRASGVAGLSNFREGRVVTRPIVPAVEPPVVPEVLPEAQIPAAEDGAPLGNPANVLPALPTNGTPPEGQFKIIDELGSVTTVTVGRDGTTTFAPPSDSSRPAIARLKPGSRTMRVSWSQVDGTNTYKVTARSGRTVRTCRSTKLACTVKNVDPWRKWTFQVEATTDGSRQLSGITPAFKSYVKVKKGSSPRLTNIVKPGAKGKASWKVNGACKVSGSKLTTPKRASRCTLTVKVGKSTRTVSIRVG